MSNSGSITVKIPLPLDVHIALTQAAASEDRSMRSAIRIAIKRYIENPAGTPTNLVKAVAKPADGLTPQQRTAKTKAEQKKEREREARQQKLASRPEFDEDGYEVFRGDLSSWTPSNPGEGYEAVPSMLDGEAIWVRMPVDAHEASMVIADNRYKADLPEGLEDVDEDDA